MVGGGLTQPERETIVRDLALTVFACKPLPFLL